MNDRHKRPYVPCFSGNNRNNFFVSCAAVAVASATKVTLVCAELAKSFQG
jgi:hypothetical protein